jgi:AcrR family transcriptional regulator
MPAASKGLESGRPRRHFAITTRPPEPRKAPKQGRSRQTVRAIREACGIVLRREGPDALTTQRIADVAGVNIASLYQYFPNKEAVIADFLDGEATRFAERTAELFSVIDRLSRHSLEHTLAAIVELELDQRRALVEIIPAFFERYPQSVDIHAKVDALTRARDNPAWASWLPDFLAQHRSQLHDIDVDLLAIVCHGALKGVVTRCSESPDGSEASADAKVELLFLLLSYLMASPPGRDDCRRYLRELGDGISMADIPGP